MPEWFPFSADKYAARAQKMDLPELFKVSDLHSDWPSISIAMSNPLACYFVFVRTLEPAPKLPMVKIQGFAHRTALDRQVDQTPYLVLTFTFYHGTNPMASALGVESHLMLLGCSNAAQR